MEVSENTMEEIDMDKKIIVCKLPADGSLRAITEEIPDNLTQLQHYVDGYIEIVTLDRLDDGSRVVMIVNDCGLIWGLPLNPIASIVYHDCLGAETPITGNAIICCADAEGELRDISPFTAVHLLLLAKQMRKEMQGNDQRGS